MIRKEKMEAQMIREVMSAKYKKREPLKPYNVRTNDQANRLKSVQSDTLFTYGLEPLKMLESSGDITMKEDIKSPFLHRVKEVLTKPIKDTDANKLPDYNAHLKRLDFLKKKYTTTEVERVNRASYFSL